MSLDFGIIQRHPVATAGVVFVIGVGYLMWRGASSSVASATGATSDPSLAIAQLNAQTASGIASTQANSQVALAQISAGLQGQQSTDQLTAALAAIQEDLAKANLSADLSTTQMQSQQAIAQMTLDAQKYTTGLAAQIQQTQQGYDYQTGIAEINAATHSVDVNADTQNQLIGVIKQVLTPPTPAPPAPPPPAPVQKITSWSDYVKDNPDLYAFYESLPQGTLEGIHYDSMEQFGAMHYMDYGQAEGRAGVGQPAPIQ